MPAGRPQDYLLGAGGGGLGAIPPALLGPPGQSPMGLSAQPPAMIGPPAMQPVPPGMGMGGPPGMIGPPGQMPLPPQNPGRRMGRPSERFNRPPDDRGGRRRFAGPRDGKSRQGGLMDEGTSMIGPPGQAGLDDGRGGELALADPMIQYLLSLPQFQAMLAGGGGMGMGGPGMGMGGPPTGGFPGF